MKLRNKIKLVDYSEDYYDTLGNLLQEFRLESEGSYGDIELDFFIDAHNYMYMIEDENGVAIGFVAYVVTNNFGLTDDMLLVDYVYIVSKKRKSRAFYEMIMKTGELALKHNCSFSFFTESPELKAMTKRFNSKLSYSMYTCAAEDCKSKYDELSKTYYKGK